MSMGNPLYDEEIQLRRERPVGPVPGRGIAGVVPGLRGAQDPGPPAVSGALARQTSLPEGLDANAAQMADPSVAASMAEQAPALKRAAELRQQAVIEAAKSDEAAYRAAQKPTGGVPTGGLALGGVRYGSSKAAPAPEADPYAELAALAAQVKRSKKRHAG